jgi:hypothetical protein
MPSPFPGIDPYIEGSDWRDFHTTFNVMIRLSLQQQLGAAYKVSVEYDLFIHEPSADERLSHVVADVSLTEGSVRHRQSAVTSVPTQTTLRVDLVEERLKRIEIRDAKMRRLVTVIELLSPTSKKRDQGRTSYFNKRLNYLAAGANLVEIDLLRGGSALPMEPQPASPFYTLVARADQDKQDVWPIGLREALPVVPLPLKPDDSDAVLELQAIFDQTYDAGGYKHRLYDTPPEPPLSPEDAAWAADFLADSSRK